MHHHNDYQTHISKIIHIKGKLGLLYLHLIVQAFSVSLISIFVPIYLLTIDFSLTQVFTYLLVEWTFFGLFAPLYGKIIHKIGLREVILFRTPFYILGLIMLFLLENNTGFRNFYLLIPMIIGASGSLYTLSITTLFAKYMGEKKQSEKTAKMLSYPQIFSIASPTIGGIIVAYLGFSFLIILVSILLFISIIPIYLIKKKIKHPKFNLKVIKEVKFDLKEFLLLNSYGLKGTIFFLVLPITIYLYSENIMSLGIIITGISLLSAVFTIYLGKKLNKIHNLGVIKLGAISTFILLILMGYFVGSPVIYYLSFFSGFINILINLPYETHLYNKSRTHKSPLEFLVFKEFSLFFGRIVLFGILILFFTDIKVAYYVAATVSLIFLFF